MQKIKNIAAWFSNYNIQLYVVGGYVRDEIMGTPSEDMDICLVGGGTAAIVSGKLEALKATGHIDTVTTVHGSFPIWIVEINGTKYEFAMARKERKLGQSRTEFETEVKDVTIEEDLMRRDFTINAIAKNVLTEEIIDPFYGRMAIRRKMLSPVSEAFKEDSLRVIRAARFISRFQFTPTSLLKDYCRDLKPTDISAERVGMELMKTLKQVEKPSMFFNFLKEVGWLGYFFKELEDCIGVPQSPIHHPEGDVYTHTMHCIDAADGWFARTVMTCHDLGKAITTKVDGMDYKLAVRELRDIQQGSLSHKVTAHGHEEAGVQLTYNMLKRIHFTDHSTIRRIGCFVELHMIRATMTQKNYDKLIRRTLRKLMHHNLTYPQLLYIIWCDLAGRPPKEPPSLSELYEQMHLDHARNLVINGEMEPIVTGEKLLEIGIPSGPEMGQMITKALELQDRGTLTKYNWRQVLHGAGFKKQITI